VGFAVSFGVGVIVKGTVGLLVGVVVGSLIGTAVDFWSVLHPAKKPASTICLRKSRLQIPWTHSLSQQSLSVVIRLSSCFGIV
jgi:hypothetical protein